jgi:Zn-finger nucleic acid-binding protein
MTSTALSCPKCRAEMRTYERSGIHIDQCAECRGIFLDRGELERLMDAEAEHYERQRRPAPPPAAAAAGPAPADRWGDPQRDAARRERRRDDDWDEDRFDDDRRGDDRRDDDRRDPRDPRGGQPGGQPRRRRSFLGDILETFGGE